MLILLIAKNFKAKGKAFQSSNKNNLLACKEVMER
jgi:hypothetical protein